MCETSTSARRPPPAPSLQHPHAAVFVLLAKLCCHTLHSTITLNVLPLSGPQDSYYMPWKCHHERHTYEKCLYDEYVVEGCCGELRMYATRRTARSAVPSY